MREGESDLFSRDVGRSGMPKVLLGWGLKPFSERGYDREIARERDKETTPK